MRQKRGAGDVADREDVGDVRAPLLVDGDEAAVVDSTPARSAAISVAVGRPAHRHQHAVEELDGGAFSPSKATRSPSARASIPVTRVSRRMPA